MIEVSGLTRYFGDRPALLDVSFVVPQGQSLGIAGPPAAGKSTLLRLLAGCLAASAGGATLAGLDLLRRSTTVRRQVGYLAESNPLYEEMRVEGHLHFLGSLRGMSARYRAKRVEEVLDYCGLIEWQREVIARMPREARQRLGLAQAVLHDPPLLLLDSPWSGLKDRERAKIRTLVGGLARGRTTIVAARVSTELPKKCDRVLVLEGGRLGVDAPPSQLLDGLVAGANEVVIVVRGSTEALEPQLRQIQGVVEVRSEPLEDGHMQLVVRQRKDVREQLCRSVMRAKLGLLEISLREPKP